LGKFPTGLRGDVTRKVQGKNSPKSSPALRGPLTTDQIIKEVQGIILQFPIKQVAAEAGSTQKAVEKVRNGENAMSLRNFCNLCRANPRIAAMAAPLFGLEETDPDFVQGFSLLMNSLVRNRVAEGDSPEDQDTGGDHTAAAGDLFERLH
jgi:hypothetical protein